MIASIFFIVFLFELHCVETNRLPGANCRRPTSAGCTQNLSVHGCHWHDGFSNGDASRENVFAGHTIHLILKGYFNG